MIIGFRKTNWRRLTHHDWKGDLSFRHTLVIQFKDTFAKHFIPHQFGVAMSSKCKTMVHGVRVVLDLHSKWVVLQVDV